MQTLLKLVELRFYLWFKNFLCWQSHFSHGIGNMFVQDAVYLKLLKIYTRMTLIGIFKEINENCQNQLRKFNGRCFYRAKK